MLVGKTISDSLEDPVITDYGCTKPVVARSCHDCSRPGGMDLYCDTGL